MVKTHNNNEFYSFNIFSGCLLINLILFMEVTAIIKILQWFKVCITEIWEEGFLSNIPFKFKGWIVLGKSKADLGNIVFLFFFQRASYTIAT